MSSSIPAFAPLQPLVPLPAATATSTSPAKRSTPVCLNKRAEAARRRWQDPEYRAKMAAARARNIVVKRSNATPRSKEANMASPFAQQCGSNVPATLGEIGMPGSVLGSQEGVIEIGVGDSITHCDDEKAAAINSYAIRNQLRREKLQMFHHDKQRWMDSKLQQGEDLRLFIMSDDVKRERQLARQERARKRHARVRARKEAEASGSAETAGVTC